MMTRARRQTLRDRVTAALAERGRSQSDLARACGVSRQRIAQILDGDAVPSLPLAIRLAEETGIEERAWADGQRRTAA